MWGVNAATRKKTYLVDHHDGQEIARRRDEQSIEVMAHSRADPRAEGIQNDLSNNKEENTKGNVTKWPTVLQRAGDQQDLHTKVHSQLNRIEQVENHEKTNRVCRAQANSRLEGRQGDEEGDRKRYERADSQHPDTQRRTILVQLETNEPIDKQRCNHRTRKSILDSHKVWIRLTPRRNNTRIHHQREERQQHVQIEKG